MNITVFSVVDFRRLWYDASYVTVLTSPCLVTYRHM